MEDNQAVCTILREGRTNAMRHVHRTHRVNIDWLYEIVHEENIAVRYVDTNAQLTDILTKAFARSEEFSRLLEICQLHSQPKSQSSVGNFTRRQRKKVQKDFALRMPRFQWSGTNTHL